MGSFGQAAIDMSRGKTPRKELKARIAADEEARLANLPPEELDLLLPDEDTLKRNKRRELASQFRGRSSTILTGRLGGPGGSNPSKAGGGASGGTTTRRPREPITPRGRHPL